MAKARDEATERALTKLDEEEYALIAKIAAICEERRRLRSGQPGIGEQLKAAYKAFETARAIRYPDRYVWQFKKDGPSMKRFLLAFGLEELVARFDRYVRNGDPWFVKARHSFGAFVASVNQHAAAPTAEVDELELAPVPVGCTHLPPCHDDAAHTARKMRELRGEPF